jgi:Predicted periplasmic protein (DUF2092)
MKRKTVVLLAGVCAGLVAGVVPSFGNSPAIAATAPKPAISDDARAALAQMGKALLAKEFSFHAHTIRVTKDQGHEQLHIVHDFTVTVRRPDRLLIAGFGDDGPRKLFYDGNTVVVATDDGKGVVHFWSFWGNKRARGSGRPLGVGSRSTGLLCGGGAVGLPGSGVLVLQRSEAQQG